MSVFFYNIFLWLFRAGTHIAAIFNPKAKKWVQGRKDIFQKLQNAISPADQVIWVHCASLGEFEQGRPVIERLRLEYPACKILLTFFSPSGYEVQKNYRGADWVFYLPMDGPRTAKRFLEIVHPSLVVFVKYEFWYYYLKKIKYREIPLLLISALFRRDMSFFKWYGKLQRKMLSRFDHLFVQNESSRKLVEEIGLGSICTVSGDTRFDRVVEIAEQFKPIPGVERFVKGSGTLVAGSTWPEDEEALQKLLADPVLRNLKLVLAPHEISPKHLADLKKLFPGAVLFSGLGQQDGTEQAAVLIIDNVGMLSKLYYYADACYVGGGLRTNGVHNVLEAAVYGKPVLFGPYYHKYSEAVGLVASSGGLSFNMESPAMLQELVTGLFTNAEDRAERGRAAGAFVQAHRGATQKIIQYIQENRLLTR